MQMYLWTGAGPTHEVVVSRTQLRRMGAAFGAALTTTGMTARSLVTDDGAGTTAARRSAPSLDRQGRARSIAAPATSPSRC